MPLAFPLTLAQFMDLLPVAVLTFDCPEQVFTSRTAGGEILSADIGPRLWQGTIELGRMTPEEAAAVLPLIRLARGAGASFLARDLSRPGPRLDPKGLILGAAAVKIASVAANAREIALKGLPANYALSAGDLLRFGYGSSPVRYALHELVAPVTASASGVTGLVEVVPPIRPGAVADAAVTLVKPSCKAVIVPGSYQPGTPRRGLVEGVGFQFMQTLR